jgi:hypothetical protein
MLYWLDDFTIGPTQSALLNKIIDYIFLKVNSVIYLCIYERRKY